MPPSPSIAIHAFNPGPLTGAGNWTYLFPGPQPVLFDAGVGHEQHLATLAAAVPHGLASVIVSHAHPDHSAGAPALAARWPGASFAKMPWPGRDEEAVGWRPIAEGDVVTTAEGPLQVLHTPGHAPDHIALWDAGSRTLFAADLMQLGNTVVIPADHGGDLAAYLRSLRRVQALAPVRVLPAHGPAIDDPLALIEHYLQHRHHREVQILTALEGNIDTIDAITARIYASLDPRLMSMARQSVLAHLVKLEHEGLARRDGDRWLMLT